MAGCIVDAGLMPPAGAGRRAAYDGAQRLAERLQAFDRGKPPKNGTLPHDGLISEIDGLLGKLVDLEAYRRFEVAEAGAGDGGVGPTPLTPLATSEIWTSTPGPSKETPVKRPRRVGIPALAAALAVLAGGGFWASHHPEWFQPSAGADDGTELPAAEPAPQKAEREALERQQAKKKEDDRLAAEAEARLKAQRAKEAAEAKMAGEMVPIPAGEFWMGSADGDPEAASDEKPRHKVKVEAFSLGKYEVTRAQYAACVADGQCASGPSCWTVKNGKWEEQSGADWRKPGFDQPDDNHPVVCVSLDDAIAYIQWLNRKTGKVYRFPTEAEWEYAARAGTDTSRYWGDNAADACRYANGADQTLKQQIPDWSGTIHDCADGYVYTPRLAASRQRFQTARYVGQCLGVDVSGGY